MFYFALLLFLGASRANAERAAFPKPGTARIGGGTTRRQRSASAMGIPSGGAGDHIAEATMKLISGAGVVESAPAAGRP